MVVSIKSEGEGSFSFHLLFLSIFAEQKPSSLHFPLLSLPPEPLPRLPTFPFVPSVPRLPSLFSNSDMSFGETGVGSLMAPLF